MAMTLRPNPDQDAALSRLATTWGVSKQTAALRAIEEMDARANGIRQVETVGRRVIERWAPVLDKLAET